MQCPKGSSRFESWRITGLWRAKGEVAVDTDTCKSKHVWEKKASCKFMTTHFWLWSQCTCVQLGSAKSRLSKVLTIVLSSQKWIIYTVRSHLQLSVKWVAVRFIIHVCNEHPEQDLLLTCETEKLCRSARLISTYLPIYFIQISSFYYADHSFFPHYFGRFLCNMICVYVYMCMKSLYYLY